MKKLLFVLFIISALFLVAPARAETTTVERNEIDLGGGMIAISTVTTTSINSVCKSQSHRIDYYYNGNYVAWTKLTAKNGCWGACMTLEDSSRSHWATPGWAVSWGGCVLGGAKCTSNPIIRSTYDNIYGPNGIKYKAYQQMEMWIDAPLKFTWYWWSRRQ